jgi:FkbM family methyltransferase
MSTIERMPIIRRAAEVFFRNKKVIRRLPNGVDLFLSPDSQLKYLKHTFDEDLVQLSREHVSSASIVWDIGANCGVFAFSCANAKQVVAVEADPFLCSLLQQSTQMNGVPITIVTAAIYSRVDFAEFSIAGCGRACNHLTSVQGRIPAEDERGRLMVPTTTLDKLLETMSVPTLVKIDVEGAEIEALKGAARLLRKVRPIIYIETGNDTHEACQGILHNAGYALSRWAATNWLAVPQ